jgi:GNAT superfamily N-acetyltransferase
MVRVMPVASLGFRTDLMLLALQGSAVDERADGLIVVHTPSNPAFWWGNFVLAPAPDALPAAVACFAAEFPAAHHVAIGVDGTDGAPGIDDVAGALGLAVERITMLSATAVHPPPRPNAAAELRRLSSAADFAQSVALQGANVPGEDPGFVAQRVADWRVLQERGHGAWFGAFLDGRLCAGLGLFTDGSGVARFQAVDTHPDFRGRGLAGTLVHHAATDGLTWPGVRTLVIAADPAYHAIRIYRSVGFDGTETQLQLVRRPPGRDA